MQVKFKRSTLSLCLGVALAGAGVSYYQATGDALLANQQDFQISEQKMAFLTNKKAHKDAHPKRMDKPQEAMDFYLSQRAPLGDDYIPTQKYGEALRHMKDMAQYSIKNDKLLPSRNALKGARPDGVEPGVVQQWENLGPGNIGGRTRTLVIDPQTTDTMYTAGVSGGVWKTVDGGLNWQALDDMMVNLAVSTMVMSPQNNNTLYAGTGEGFFNADAARGDGVFVTKDGGETWSQLAATANNRDFRYINKLAASSVAENRLYAATATGLFRSIDGGESWSKLMDAPNSDGCMDVQIAPGEDGNDVVLTACGSFSGATVFRSSESGDNITAVIQDELLGRTTIAISPSDPNVVYALGATNAYDQTAYTYGFYKLYRSDDGGATWTVKNDYNNENVLNTLLLSNPIFGLFPECGWSDQRSFYNQGWYDNIIQVDPVNPDTVWVGGIDLWRSDDAGSNWMPASRWWANTNEPVYAHADQHAIVFHPNYDGETNTTMYVGNDGGIQKTNNAKGGLLGWDGICGAPVENTVTWEGLNNNLAITQFYHGGVFPDGTAYLGGTQDNGTLLGAAQLGQQWLPVLGGDGGWVAIDPRNPDIVFGEYTGLSLTRYEPEQQAWVDATAGIDSGAAFPFITPYIMDQNNPDRLWIGNDRLWRTEDQGRSWVQASAPTLDESVVSEWAVAPGNSDRVIAGTNRGSLLISTSATTTDANTQWTAVKPTDGYVSDVAISPTNNRVAYATYSTFGVNHIYKTIDGGLTWQAIDNQGQENGLPDIPVNTIVIDPSNTARLFVGTDLGIFVSVDAGRNWSVDGSGFANTSVAHLEINNGQLFAFTHGRSAYKVALSTLPTALPVSVETDEDTEVNLNAATFSRFTGGMPQVEQIAFTALPENGTLKFNGEAITELSPFALADLAQVSFVPAANFNGETTIGWHAVAADAATSTTGRFTFVVNAKNDAPAFTLKAGVTKVKAGENAYVRVASVEAGEVPADEAEQTVTYSVSPSQVGFASVQFDSQTGTLSVAPVGKETGSATFTITASDGQNENGTHSESVTFTVEKKSSGGGSFGMLSLLALFGLGSRVVRRKR